MKFIQSFWSKPLLSQEHKDNRLFRFKGGFPSNFLFLCAWTYSCLTIKKYYGNLHLVTDSYGIEIFKNILDLPYTSFSEVLDNLEGYHEGFWALGKLYTYQLQEEPFCHIDGDVFVFGDVFRDLLDKPVFCQSYDYNSEQYSEIHPYVHENFDKVPKAFEADLTTKIKFLNVGVIGGSDIDLFQKYTHAAFQLIDANQEKVASINVSLLNLYYEQFLLSNIIANEGISVDSLYKLPDNEAKNKFVDFVGIPNRSKYIHLISGFKRSTKYMEQVVMRLMLEYPEYYKRLLKYNETVSYGN